MTQTPLILVTGATGYVATRLIPALLERGYRVRVLARNPERLQPRAFYDRVETVQGEIQNPRALSQALDGVHVAYYLVHNMSSGRDYWQVERECARNFGMAARTAAVERIIYLGGLGGEDNKRHLHSRQETGKELQASGVPVTEFRASAIIGSGSISFEMIRSLTGWLPLLPNARPTRVPGQPIGIETLLQYLLGALENPACEGKIIEIGGTDRLNYPDLMQIYARKKGLKRLKIPIPFFSAHLAAQLANLVSPVPFSIAYPLLRELVVPSIVSTDEAKVVFPNIESKSYSDYIEYALQRKEYSPEVSWTSSLVVREALIYTHVHTLGEGLLIDYLQREVPILPEVISRLFNGNQAGGWVTEGYKPGEWVRLKSGQVLPGVLRVEIQHKNGMLSQTAMFEPRGHLGLLWWYLGRPLHRRQLVKTFNALVRGFD